MAKEGIKSSNFVYFPHSFVGDDFNTVNKENNATANSLTEQDPCESQGSGFSVDVGVSATNCSTSHYLSEVPNVLPLEYELPVTMVPINPPKRMMVG